MHIFNSIPTTVNLSPPVVLQTPVTTSSTPAFLSRFPRSLSSLSLGGKKKSIEKEVSSLNTSGISEISTPSSLYGSHLTTYQHHIHNIPMVSAVKNKFTGSTKDLKSSGDQPPPLPQRNITRRSQQSPTAPLIDGVDGEVMLRRNTQISDLDNSLNVSGNSVGNDNTNNNNNNLNAINDNNSNNNKNNINKANSDIKNLSTSSTSPTTSSSAKGNKKRNKTKIKANSDPKISTHLFIQMEKDYDKQQIVTATGCSIGNEPPPLPPRQPGMLEENQNLLNNNKFMSSNNSGTSGCGNAGNRNNDSINNRPSPNSLETLLNYPLIATCTAVRDNISPYPLSHRPNIVQQLQQSNSNTVHQHHPSSSSSVSKSTVSNFLLLLSPQYTQIQSRTLIFLHYALIAKRTYTHYIFLNA